MANPEHLEILNQGVEAWNRWREREPQIKPDLRGADLAGADLRHAVLQSADLENAALRTAQLEGADLREAILVRVQGNDADFFRADLTGATCIEANFRHAYLVEVSFVNANLGFASFSGALLSGASIKGAGLIGTALSNIDLSQTNGLSNVLHVGPSYVDTNTLERTFSGLSDPLRRAELEMFCLGAGVGVHWIEFSRTLAGNSIRLLSCFISYSHADGGFARRLHDQLQSHGIRCWIGEHDLKPGDRILDVVSDAIRLHDKILLCCSKASFESWWVKDEIRKAIERERREGRDIIIPLMVDRYLLDGWEDGLAADLRARLAADFTGWEHDNAKFEEQFEQVVRALRTDEGAREKTPDATSDG